MSKKEFIVDKTKMRDVMNRFMTQGLFLESATNTDFSMFTLEDEDKIVNGKIYYSLKKRYLEKEDLTEYEFAKEFLGGWEHWLKICNNRILREYVDVWREELKLKIKAAALQVIINQALTEENFPAAKYLSEGAWDKKTAGRPSKEQLEKERSQRDKLSTSYADDAIRLKNFSVVA